MPVHVSQSKWSIGQDRASDCVLFVCPDAQQKRVIIAATASQRGTILQLSQCDIRIRNHSFIEHFTTHRQIAPELTRSLNRALTC